MSVAPLRLRRHIDEHAMSYMQHVLQRFTIGILWDPHDRCFSARATLLDAELVPHVAVTPLLHVNGNLSKHTSFLNPCAQGLQHDHNATNLGAKRLREHENLRP